MRASLLINVIIAVLSVFLYVSDSGSSDHSPRQTFHEWQVIDVKAERPVLFEEWVATLLEKDVVYLGEEHRNQWHIEGALRILRALLQHGRNPTIGMEMFGWDGQAGLDQYVSEEITSRDQFVNASRWEQNWGGSFDDYAPLIGFAREHHLPVLALNPPRPLVRRVATQGLAHALADPEMRRWGLQDELFVESPAYRDVIVRQLRLCHGGMSDEGYERMYEASVFRDEGMAKTIADYLARKQTSTGGRPLLSYTGGGHIQYHLPVPDRVLRKTGGKVQQTTVYLTSFVAGASEDIQTLLRESIADYLWLTPVGTQDPAKRCR